MALIPLSIDTQLTPSWTGNSQRDQTILRANDVAALLPDLLIAADRIAANMVSGLHGRRRVGSGDNFWQFRQFSSGDTVNRVDWRRSGRSDALFIREHEWDTPQSVWLWCDTSLSMRVKSTFSDHSKLERGLLLMFAIARLLSNAGEKIGLLGLTNSIMGRHAQSTLAERLSHHLHSVADGVSLPDCTRVTRHSDVVLISDFMADAEELEQQIKQLESTGARLHVLQVLDPLEQTFPFKGRIEFRDPETGQRLVAGKAEDWQHAYQALVDNLQQTLKDECTVRGWSYQFHLTDRPASAALLSLHLALAGTMNGSAHY